MVSSVINNSAINDAVSRFDTANFARYSRNVNAVVNKKEDGLVENIVNKVSYTNKYPEDNDLISLILKNYNNSVNDIINNFNNSVRIEPDANDTYFEKFKQYTDLDYQTYLQFKMAAEDYAKSQGESFDDVMSTFEFYV